MKKMIKLVAMILTIVSIVTVLPVMSEEASAKKGTKKTMQVIDKKHKCFKYFVKDNNIKDSRYVRYGLSANELKFENAKEFNEWFDKEGGLHYIVDGYDYFNARAPEDREAQHLIGDWVDNVWEKKVKEEIFVFQPFVPQLQLKPDYSLRYYRGNWHTENLLRDKNGDAYPFDILFKNIWTHLDHIPLCCPDASPDCAIWMHCYDDDYEGTFQVWMLPRGQELGDFPWAMNGADGDYLWFWPEEGANVCTITIGHSKEEPELMATCLEDFCGTRMFSDRGPGNADDYDLEWMLADYMPTNLFKVTYDIIAQVPRFVDTNKVLQDSKYKNTVCYKLADDSDYVYKIGEGVELVSCDGRTDIDKVTAELLDTRNRDECKCSSFKTTPWNKEYVAKNNMKFVPGIWFLPKRCKTRDFAIHEWFDKSRINKLKKEFETLPMTRKFYGAKDCNIVFYRTVAKVEVLLENYLREFKGSYTEKYQLVYTTGGYALARIKEKYYKDLVKQFSPSDGYMRGLGIIALRWHKDDPSEIGYCEADTRDIDGNSFVDQQLGGIDFTVPYAEELAKEAEQYTKKHKELGYKFVAEYGTLFE